MKIKPPAHRTHYKTHDKRLTCTGQKPDIEENDKRSYIKGVETMNKQLQKNYPILFGRKEFKQLPLSA